MDDLGLALILLLVSSQSRAQEVFFDYGLGIFNSAKNAPTEVKVADIGYRGELYNGLYWQSKVGYWGEGSGDPTRNSSFYFSTGPTLLIDLKPIELRSGWGLATISDPDSYLGGNFPQFNGEVYAGVRDMYGNGIGVKYEHISSAGLVQPNVGRDFIALEISSKW